MISWWPIFISDSSKEFPEKDAYKKGVEQTINLKHEITNVETPLEVWEMIWKIKTDIEASA